MYRKMLIANDGSPGGAKALAGALELARRLEIGLAMICVEELPRFPVTIGEIVEAQADAASVFEKVVASAAKLARAQEVAFESRNRDWYGHLLNPTVGQNLPARPKSSNTRFPCRRYSWIGERGRREWAWR